MRSGPHDGFIVVLRTLAEIMVIALFILTFIAQPYRIPSGSMEPTLRIGDFLLANKAAYSPHSWLGGILPPAEVHRGDLVVFHFPIDPTRHLVKRVIAVPGDRIRLRAGRVILNGAPLDEPYAYYTPSRVNAFRDDFPNLRDADPNVDPHWWIELRRSVADNEVTVPPGSYFVLGDNRNDSEDSRYWGFVPRRLIVGRPMFVYFSIPQQFDAGASRLLPPQPEPHGLLGTAWHSIRVLR